MSAVQIQIPKEELTAFCQREGIRRLSVFGSALTERFSDASDIDMLVEFQPEQRVGYIRLAGMELELSNLLGRKVDLRTPRELSHYFRGQVMESAAIQYDAR